MDSPIFGSQKCRVNNKGNNGHSVQLNRVYNSESALQWQFSKKTAFNTTTQLGNQLKLAYLVLIMEKNFQSLFFKIAKCLNKRKHQGFRRILTYSRSEMAGLLTQRQYLLTKHHHQVNNPQTTIAQICMKQTQQKLQLVIEIISRLQLKKLAKAWRQLTIQTQINPSPDHTGSTIMLQSTTLAISTTKLQSKKHLNIKKHPKQIKQNSSLNHSKNPQLQSQNQRLSQELTLDEMNFEKFTAKMNTLLAYHEGLLTGETTDRLSEGKEYHAGGSMYSYENNNLNYQQHHNKPIQGTKSQVYTKKK